MKGIAAHKGKVVLVHFWANYHLPSKVLFPQLVKLQEKHLARGLVCIAVSIDPQPAKSQEKVRKFVNDQKADFAHYLVEDSDECMDHWNFLAIPAYLVFSTDGKLAHKFDLVQKVFQFQDVEQAVEKQLN